MMTESRKLKLLEKKRLFSDLGRSMPAVMLCDVYKDYSSKSNGETSSLKDVSLTIEKGEFVFIIGDSGAGKSTLLKLLMREIIPTSGRIFVNGKNLKRLRRSQVAKHRRNIGIVFQDFKLLKSRTVYDNVAFAMEILGETSSLIRSEVPRLLERVGLLGKSRAYPSELSGGEQQRVALARALVNNPKLLLADEPTGNLDPGSSRDIMRLIEEVNNKGTTVVVVTHNIEIVNSMNKRVIELNNGVIIRDEDRM